MLVHPDQLVEKCIIVKDIYGKTSYPIISKQTVINETYIKVLKDFLIKEVLVASKLADGLPYQPDKDNSVNDEHSKTTSAHIEHSSFLDQYLAGVEQYETIFKQLQSGRTLDVYEFRLLIQPLIEKIDQYKANIFLLGKHATGDKYIYHHSVSIGLLAAVLAKQLGFEQEMMQIALAAMIADSGMARLNHKLFKQKSELTKLEMTEIKKHPTSSYRYIEHNSALTRGAKLAVLQHHEQPDGQGYPLGLTNEKIHPYAKIISIADAYHAMTSNRFYQQGNSFDQVIIDMQKDSNQKFDQHYLATFISCIEESLLNEHVYLSNGKTGTIVALSFSNYPEFIVKIHDSNEIRSLLKEDDLHVKAIIEK